MMVSRLSAMGSACTSMKGGQPCGRGRIHLLRGANTNRLLQPLLLIEVLEEMQRVLRRAHGGGVFRRWLSLRIYLKVDSEPRVVGACIGARRTLQPPPPTRLGSMESLGKGWLCINPKP